MADVVDWQTRSRMMSGIRGKNTKPEIFIRKALHAGGYRFRLHRKDLPGSPDIVLPKYRAVILINGCFWHGHDCRLFKWPKTRPDFWREKIERNIRRDQRNQANLKQLGWRLCILWECQIKGGGDVRRREVITRIMDWLDDETDEIHIPHSRTESGPTANNIG